MGAPPRTQGYRSTYIAAVWCERWQVCA
eukprot:COSAG01_NODE_30154_length_621_cov_2.273946_2_plen_27_part_01